MAGHGRVDVQIETSLGESMGYDCAVAIATKAEIESGAACGQLAIVCEA